jgi:hypothetical protein
MTDAYAVINITERKLEQLICKNTRRIRKPKQRMIRKNRPQPHRPRMQNALMTHGTQTPMSMHNLNPLPDANIPKHRKTRKHGGKGGLAVDDEEGDVVDLEAVCEVADAFAVVVGVGYDDYFVAAVD